MVELQNYEKERKNDEIFLETKKDVLSKIYNNLCSVLDDESKSSHVERMTTISCLFSEYVKVTFC